MRKLLIAVALAGTALSGAAIAGQMNGRGHADMMQRADTNKDGSISRAEFIAMAEQRFARLDKNGDGKLSGDELAGRRGMMAAHPGKDGIVTKADFLAQSAARFDKMDANHDGKISPDEMKAMMERMRESRGAPGAPGTMPPPGGRGDHRARMMERVDTNHDGKISRAEMRAQADARFDKLDTNHDGFVDQAELAAAKQHWGKKHGHGRHRPAMPGATPPSGDAPQPDAGQ